MLEIDRISAGYGKIIAVDGLSFRVEKGTVVALLGPNGAGKTTTVRAIFGLLPVCSGSVTLDGQVLNKLPAHRIVRQGLALVPQGRELFPGLSVLDNLHLGAYTVSDSRIIHNNLDRVFHYFPRLADRRRQAVGSLSGGEQQMVAVGRALMAGPKLLVLDEPSVGLAPKVVTSVFDIVARINKEEGMGVLVAEQNARQAMRIADYAYVLETGRLAAEGTPEQLLANDAILASYLGAEVASGR